MQWARPILYFFSCIAVAFFLAYFFDIDVSRASSLRYSRPSAMKVLFWDGGGLSTKRVEVPQILNQANVLVKLRACSLAKLVGGEITCLGFSGVVVDVGSASKIFETGAKVFGFMPHLSHDIVAQEYVEISESSLAYKPISLNFFQASLVPLFTKNFYHVIKTATLPLKSMEDVDILIDDLNPPEAEMVAIFLQQMETVNLYVMDLPKNKDLIKKLNIRKLYSPSASVPVYFSFIYKFSEEMNLGKFLKEGGLVIEMKQAKFTENESGEIEKMTYVADLAHDGKIPLFVDKIITFGKIPRKAMKFDFVNDNIILDISGK